EDRTLLAITVTPPTDAPQWTDLGPYALRTNRAVGMTLQNNPVAGAVVAFAAAPASASDPFAPTVAFAATAGGGVWETNDLNATKAVDRNQVNDPNLEIAPPASVLSGGPPGGVAGTGQFDYKLTFGYAGGLESNASVPVSLMGDANRV